MKAPSMGHCCGITRSCMGLGWFECADIMHAHGPMVAAPEKNSVGTLCVVEGVNF